MRRYGAEVVRVFHAIQHHDQRRVRGYVFEFRVLLFRAERDDTLMGFDAREAVHCAAIFEADRSAGVAGEVNDFLHAAAGQSTRYEDAFERALRAECFGYGVKTNENGQARLSRDWRTQCGFMLDLDVQTVVETVGEIRHRDHERQFHELILTEVLSEVFAGAEFVGAGARHLAGVVQGGLFGWRRKRSG